MSDAGEASEPVLLPLARPGRRRRRADSAEESGELPFFTDVFGSPEAALAVAAAAASEAAAGECGAVLGAAAAADAAGEAAAAEAVARACADGAADVAEVAAFGEGEAEDAQPALRRSSTSFETLERYLQDARPAERAKRLRAKAENERYYVAADAEGSALAASARTDDGYLTRAGAKAACVVCCRGGHRAFDCPELRCYFCYATGHPGKKCPHASLKCERCGRRGHSKEVCLWDLLVDAARARSWGTVRCVRCGEPGHPMCSPPEEVAQKPAPERQPKQPRRSAKRAAAIGAALTGRVVNGSSGRHGSSGGEGGRTGSGERSHNRSGGAGGNSWLRLGGSSRGDGGDWSQSRPWSRDSESSAWRGWDSGRDAKSGWRSAEGPAAARWGRHNSQGGQAKESFRTSVSDLAKQLRAKLERQGGRNGLRGEAAAESKNKRWRQR